MNRLTRTPALILQTWPIGDTHRGARMLLAECGLAEACAYGTAGRKNPLKGTLQTLTAGTITLWQDKIRNRYRVEAFDPMAFYEGIKSDLDRMEAASLWCEVVIKSVKPGEETIQVFALLMDALELLNGSECRGTAKINNLSAQFLWKYLNISGFGADFSQCHSCGAAPGLQETAYWRGDGEMHCFKCGEPGDLPIDPGSKFWMIRTAEKSLKETLSIVLDERGQKQVLRILILTLEYLIGTPLKSNTIKGRT